MVCAHDRLTEAKMTRYACMQKLSLGKKEKSCDVHVHVRVKVVDFGWNDNDTCIDDGDGDDELVTSITYLTYPTLHAPVEWQSSRVQR